MATTRGDIPGDRRAPCKAAFGHAGLRARGSWRHAWLPKKTPQHRRSRGHRRSQCPKKNVLEIMALALILFIDTVRANRHLKEQRFNQSGRSAPASSASQVEAYRLQWARHAVQLDSPRSAVVRMPRIFDRTSKSRSWTDLVVNSAFSDLDDRVHRRAVDDRGTMILWKQPVSRGADG